MRKKSDKNQLKDIEVKHSHVITCRQSISKKITEKANNQPRFFNDVNQNNQFMTVSFYTFNFKIYFWTSIVIFSRLFYLSNNFHDHIDISIDIDQ